MIREALRWLEGGDRTTRSFALRWPETARGSFFASTVTSSRSGSWLLVQFDVAPEKVVNSMFGPER